MDYDRTQRCRFNQKIAPHWGNWNLPYQVILARTISLLRRELLLKKQVVRGKWYWRHGYKKRDG